MSLRLAETVASVTWRGGKFGSEQRSVPAETPVAFVYDGEAQAVMMATPADLQDFAVGFSLNDGAIAAPDEIRALDIIEAGRGIELRIALDESRRGGAAKRRRGRAGPVGCGLCGIESLQDALPKLPQVAANISVTPSEIIAAMRAMAPLQALNAQTRAVHAAAFYMPGGGIIAVREDVGRHNALDKLAGALARAGHHPSGGAILMTSRISVELVQKAAMMGAPILAAVSVPTALALREAEAAGITIAGIVREDGFEVFTHGERVRGGEPAHAS
jgi:FdhD protein